MKEIKIHIEETLLAQLEELCSKRDWSTERGLSIAAEAGIRNLLWLENFPEGDDRTQSDEIKMKKTLLDLSSRVSALKYQNFELSQDNRNYKLREGALKSKYENLMRKKELEEGE